MFLFAIFRNYKAESFLEMVFHSACFLTHVSFLVVLAALKIDPRVHFSVKKNGTVSTL